MNVQGRYVGVWVCLYGVGMWLCGCAYGGNLFFCDGLLTVLLNNEVIILLGVMYTHILWK